MTNDIAPTASNAGTNQAQCNSGSFTLAGNAASVGTGTWAVVSGTATITSIHSATSTVTAVPSGSTATLSWTIVNGTCSTTSNVTLTNDIAPTASNAGTNQAQCNSGSFTLAGNAASAGTGTWAVVSGTATITSIHSATSTVTAVPSGSTATLSWTIVNGTCSTTSNVTLTNDAATTASNAGSNQTMCTSGGNLSANTPVFGTGVWSISSGASSNLSQFSNITDPNSSFVPIGGVGNYDLVWTITNSTCSSTSSVTITVINSGTWLGNTDDWFDASNWCSGVPASTTNVLIPSTAPIMPNIASSGALCNSLIINSGASLSMNSGSDLTVYGNWTNSGTFTSGGGTVTFAGSSSQSFTGTTTFDNIYINNGSGLTLNNNIVVNNVIELDTGNVTTGSNLVQIEANAYPVAIGGYIDGNLKEYISSGFFVSASFPIGAGTNFTPLDLTFDNVYTDGYITAYTSNGDHAQISSSGFNASQTVNRTWSLINSGVTYDQYTAGLTYLSSDEDAGFVDTYAAVKQYSSGSWIDLPNGASSTLYESVSNVTTFGDFQIGVINPVPSLYSLSPSSGALGQTLNVTFIGAGFITGSSTVNVGTGISVNTITVNSDTSLTANLSISSGATSGSRPYSVTNGAPGGGTSGTVNFNLVGSLPIPDFTSTSLSIYCNTDGTTTFYNSSSGATSYLWDFGTGASPATGTGAGPFTVSYSSYGLKTVKLVAGNAYGTDSIVKTNYISVNSFVPATPGSISGLAGLCSSVGANVTYTISPILGATGYSWSIPTGLTYVSGQGTTSLIINPTSGFTTGILSVVSTNGCGTSLGSSSYNLSSTPPVLTGNISGSTIICGLPVTNYSVNPVAGVSSYNWTVPTGVTISTGQGTSNITVSIGGNNIFGTVSCTALSPCGNSNTLSLAIAKKPAAPSSITGPTSLCGVTSASYSASSFGTTSYNWSVPAGVTITSGSGTSSINVNITSTLTTGYISVTAVNACGYVAATSKNVYGQVPSMPAPIVGPSNLCGLTTTSFSSSSTYGASSYTWTMPAGLSILSGQGTSMITVVNTAYSSGSITMVANNNCGSSGIRSDVLSTVAATPGSITGPNITCGLSSGTYSVAPVAGAVSYTWVVTPGVTISSGQGTSSISVTYTTPQYGGYIRVSDNNGCSTSSQNLLYVSMAPAPGAISGPTVVCGLTSTNYSITPITGALSYNWAVPSGMTLISGQGTTSITAIVPPTMAAGSVKVSEQNACGNSTGTSLVIGACASPLEMDSEMNSENMFSPLYPNPTTNEFSIDINTSNDMEVIEQIFDIMGNKVMDHKYEIVKGQFLLKTNIDELNSGIYFVRLLDKDSNVLYNEKVIKQ